MEETEGYCALGEPHHIVDLSCFLWSIRIATKSVRRLPKDAIPYVGEKKGRASVMS